jgi:hypothetical protein
MSPIARFSAAFIVATVAVQTTVLAQGLEVSRHNPSERTKGCFSEVATVNGPGKTIYLAGIGAEDESGPAAQAPPSCIPVTLDRIDHPTGFDVFLFAGRAACIAPPIDPARRPLRAAGSGRTSHHQTADKRILLLSDLLRKASANGAIACEEKSTFCSEPLMPKGHTARRSTLRSRY